MALRYPSLVKLNTTTLSDESRQPLQEDRDERSVTVELADGSLKKFIKSVKHTWSISWEYLPESATYTIDGGAGRNEIHSLVQSGNTFTLTLQDGKNTNTYTVFVDSYSETLEKRRDVFSYKLNLSLKEQ